MVRENFRAYEGFILLVCALISPKAPGPWLISEFSSFTYFLLPKKPRRLNSDFCAMYVYP